MIMCGINCMIYTWYCMFLAVIIFLWNINGFIWLIFTHIFQRCFVSIGAVVLLLGFWGWGKVLALLQTTFRNALSWMKMPLIWHSTDLSAMVQNIISQNWSNNWHRTVHKSLSSLTHWGRERMAAISQTTFSNVFSWMRILKIWLKFHWSLFVSAQFKIFQHWFR